jgi:hypothetical protein
MSPRTKLGIVVAMIIAGLDPRQQGLAAKAPATLSQALVYGLSTYPHANKNAQALMLNLARALPAIEAADANTKAAFRLLSGPYFQAIGLDSISPVATSMREAFDYSCDHASVKLSRVLDDFAWEAQSVARPSSYVDRFALRATLRKAVGQ